MKILLSIIMFLMFAWLVSAQIAHDTCTKIPGFTPKNCGFDQK
jgi:hypothetical protein